MKNIKFGIIVFITCIISMISCKEDKPNFSNCCCTAPLQASLDTGRIFIPNVFTPNNDGYNDILTVFASDGIKEVNSFIIKKTNGDVVFEAENFSPNDSSEGWGRISFEDEFVAGFFEYEVTVTSVLDQTATFTGNVCSYMCNDEGFPTSVLGDCGFGTQHDGLGNWDTNAPQLEEDCF